ncbi:hypothetical protein VMCG_06266 [Cytospora schulzeri]|uniref:Ecp2 effector protein domain-containing protein n=1 Tax=Cytospora schulzeri TaxID=448051 RepID=A0A423W968_9PEZI|nr:hypothetical protein VMCG_06266 [Valsa malicola]
MRFGFAFLKALVVLAGASTVSAAPFSRWSVPQEHLEILALRRAVPLNPDAVSDVHCQDRQAHIIFHEENAAQLAICGGISGTTDHCGGSRATTVGRKGSARFTLRAVNAGATIDVSKVRWEECVHAARAVCPTGSLSAVCLGGATSGDVAFSLEMNSGE